MRILLLTMPDVRRCCVSLEVPTRDGTVVGAYGTRTRKQDCRDQSLTVPAVVWSLHAACVTACSQDGNACSHVPHSVFTRKINSLFEASGDREGGSAHGATDGHDRNRDAQCNSHLQF